MSGFAALTPVLSFSEVSEKDSLVCHSGRSEESDRATACVHPAGFFAEPQNDRAF
jgi:hypothetical protein